VKWLIDLEQMSDDWIGCGLLLVDLMWVTVCPALIREEILWGTWIQK